MRGHAGFRTSFHPSHRVPSPLQNFDIIYYIMTPISRFSCPHLGNSDMIIPHTYPPNTDMTTPSLDELVDNISTTEWFRLGLKLGLKEDDLDIIDSDKKLDARGALMAVLRKWLRQSDNSTWRAVVQAVRDIGEEKKARDLEDKFCKTV